MTKRTIGKIVYPMIAAPIIVLVLLRAVIVGLLLIAQEVIRFILVTPIDWLIWYGMKLTRRLVWWVIKDKVTTYQDVTEERDK